MNRRRQSVAREPPSPPTSLKRFQSLITREIMRGGCGRGVGVEDAEVRRLLVGSPADQDARFGCHKRDYAQKVRLCLEGFFPVLFGQLTSDEVDAFVGAYGREHASGSPMFERETFERLVAHETAKRPLLGELAALDDARHRLLRRIATRPRARAPSGAWVNPNLATLRASLPLDRIWSATRRSRRVSLKPERRQQTYAVVLAPGGTRVERLTREEERALSEPPTGPGGRRAIESLLSKAILIAD